ncbi:MAG: class I SAM-dependent RNA methyltransferase [Parvularculaceae bacterium]
MRRLQLAIDEIGAQGDGVATAEGEQVFVPLTAPGDVVVADVQAGRARIVDFVEQSGVRRAPPCPHYGACGGCSLQHVEETFYREWKRNRVASALARAGLNDVVLRDVVAMPAASRRRASFAVRRAANAWRIGFNRRRDSGVVDISGCIVLHADILARLPALRQLAAAIGATPADFSVTLCDNGLDADIAARTATEPTGAALSAVINAMRAANVIRLSMNGELVASLAPPVVNFDGVAVTPPHDAFLQASREGEAALISLVSDACAGAQKIADLFCGCGTFALPLARSASVYAADSAAGAVTALDNGVRTAQAIGAKINPIEVEVRDLFERPLSAKELARFDAVVFDPPRAGAAAQVAEIANSGAPLVVGVSCNPSTFARDARMLVDAGYTLCDVTPVDQFVYSAHVELVGLFRR